MKLFSGTSSKAMVIALLLNNSLICESSAVMLQSEVTKHHGHHKHSHSLPMMNSGPQSMTQLEHKVQAQTAPMLMAQLQSGMHEAKSLARDAIESNDEEDKKLAKKKVAQLKSTLKKLKDQVVREAQDAEKNKSILQSKKKA